MATVKAALEPAGPPLPPAVPGQVQRLQQPTAPCPRRRMATGKPRVLGSLVGPWVAGWTSCSRSALPAQGRRRGGKLRCRPSGLTMVGTKPLCAFYTSLPCRCESCVCKAMAAASQGRARTRAGTLGPGWGLSDPGGLPSFCGWHYRQHASPYMSISGRSAYFHASSGKCMRAVAEIRTATHVIIMRVPTAECDDCQAPRCGKVQVT